MALALDMGLDPGQSQLGDLADQRFDSFVFLNPLADLWEEILGDIDGARFTLFLASEVKARMTWTGQAMTTRAAAFFVNGDQAGSQQGAFGLELFEASLELTFDEGGVLGDFHNHRRIADQGLGISDKYYYLSDKARKNVNTKKGFFENAN